jgi:hypothetical protein
MIELAVRLFPAAVAALCLVGLLAVCLQVRRLGRSVNEQQENEQDPLSGVVAGLKWELISLADRISSLEGKSGDSESREVVGNATIRSGMNLNKRTQALRQYRLGQPSGDIAKTLDMPKAEVDLLLKVHRIVSQ